MQKGERGNKIKSRAYRKFLDYEEMEIITIDMIKKVLDNIRHKDKQQARALVIAMYLTGARPIEILRLTRENVERKDNMFHLILPASKRGRPRIIKMPLSNALVRELYNYMTQCPPYVLIFHRFVSKCTKTIYKNGQPIVKQRTTEKLRHWFIEWFSVLEMGDIPPYYLRHNLFSAMVAKGARPEDIKKMKGARSIKSVDPYIHMTEETQKRIQNKHIQSLK